MKYETIEVPMLKVEMDECTEVALTLLGFTPLYGEMETYKETYVDAIKLEEVITSKEDEWLNEPKLKKVMEALLELCEEISDTTLCFHSA